MLVKELAKKVDDCRVVLTKTTVEQVVSLCKILVQVL